MWQNNVLHLGLSDWQTKTNKQTNRQKTHKILHHCIFSGCLPCVFCLKFSANIIVPSLLYLLLPCINDVPLLPLYTAWGEEAACDPSALHHNPQNPNPNCPVSISVFMPIFLFYYLPVHFTFLNNICRHAQTHEDTLCGSPCSIWEISINMLDSTSMLPCG